jgi:glyoxylate reductase
MNRARFQEMKKTAFFINIGRGLTTRLDDLAAALEAGEIAGAGLDVFEHEPAIDPRLRALDNVVLLPHMGSATIEGRLAMGEKVIINIKTFADGHRPPDRVLGSML